MEPSRRRQSLERRHLPLPDLARCQHARARRLAVDEHRAGAADALATAGLRSGQPELLAENRQQHPIRRDGLLVHDPVYDELHGHANLSSPPRADTPVTRYAWH